MKNRKYFERTCKAFEKYSLYVCLKQAGRRLGIFPFIRGILSEYFSVNIMKLFYPNEVLVAGK